MSANHNTAQSTYHHGALRAALLARAAEVIEERGLEALTLRGLARDLGVSHGAPNRHFASREDLLAALATSAWEQVHAATLAQAEKVKEDPWIQLNAMGRGYLKWAIENRTLFAVITHPDVNRFADDALRQSIQRLQNVVADAVIACQATGRHPDVNSNILNLYTNAVPFGAAMLLNQPIFSRDVTARDTDKLVAELVELVVPIKGR